jgi:aldehyde dehydrogenase
LSHPGVRKVTLTGSTATGQLAAAAAAPTLKSVTLELGGNDAALVLDDVTIDDHLCSRLVANAFATTGQICMAIKRVYAPRHLAHDLVDGLVAALERTVIGDGLDPSSTMGPLTTQRQRQHVQDLLAGAEAAGAKLLPAGTLNGDPDRGWFMLPAIVTDCPEDNALVQTEQFGPALPVQSYDDHDQALSMINATEYGLTASVWTSDADRASKLARQIDAGLVHYNCHGLLATDLRVPFGGVKYSGLGRELGVEGLYEFTQTRVVNTRRP